MSTTVQTKITLALAGLKVVPNQLLISVTT